MNQNLLQNTEMQDISHRPLTPSQQADAQKDDLERPSRLNSIPNTLKRSMSSHSEQVTQPIPLKELVRTNLRSGLITGIVNFPLSIAMAVASNSRPEAGMISAIIGGLSQGVFGGSKVNILSPTVGLATFLSLSVFEFDSQEEIANYIMIFAIVTGILIYIAFKLNIQKYINLIPKAVSEGFIFGIGIVLLIQQLPLAFQLNKTKRQFYLLSTIYDIALNLKEIHLNSLAITVLSIVFFYTFKAKVPKIPVKPVMTLLGISIGLYSNFVYDLGIMCLKDKYTQFSIIKVVSNLSYSFNVLLDLNFWSNVFSVAFAAILQTLTATKIADRATNNQTNLNKEMISLAIANILSGILGGLPICVALVRTKCNYTEGANHRISSFINGLCLMFITLVFFQFFKYLPFPMIACTVGIASFDLIDIKLIRSYFKADRESLNIFLITAVFCMLLNAKAGLQIGITFFLVNFAEKLMRSHSNVYISKERCTFYLKERKTITREQLKKFPEDKKGLKESLKQAIKVYSFIGPITFLNFEDHSHQIQNLMSQGGVLIISFAYVHFLDSEAIQGIKEIIDKQMEQTGCHVYFQDVNFNVEKQMIAALTYDWYEKRIDLERKFHLE